MKAFLKTLIGGALGVGALYVVGKICYEAGKDVAEIERQLEMKSPEGECLVVHHKEPITPETLDKAFEADNMTVCSEAAIDPEKTEPIQEKRGLMDRFRNAKTFLLAKKAFDKSNKSPGILSSLLTNPDGARIEAVVRDGGVQISIKPRAA